MSNLELVTIIYTEYHRTKEEARRYEERGDVKNAYALYERAYGISLVFKRVTNQILKEAQTSERETNQSGEAGNLQKADDPSQGPEPPDNNPVPL